jgi:hypothetical protein
MLIRKIKQIRQPWWDYYTTVTREDGDGRPISLTVYEATNAIIRNFRIEVFSSLITRERGAKLLFIVF